MSDFHLRNSYAQEASQDPTKAMTSTLYNVNTGMGHNQNNLRNVYYQYPNCMASEYAHKYTAKEYTPPAKFFNLDKIDRYKYLLTKKMELTTTHKKDYTPKKAISCSPVKPIIHINRYPTNMSNYQVKYS